MLRRLHPIALACGALLAASFSLGYFFKDRISGELKTSAAHKPNSPSSQRSAMKPGRV